MVNRATRRTFLCTAPFAAGLALTDTAGYGQAAGPMAASEPFQLFTAEALAADAKALQAKPGNNNLVDAKSVPFAVVMTTEAGKAPKEFEWHEGRDHVVQILDGSTVYEVGGKPVGAHQRVAGEWNSPGSDGAKTFTLTKGDMLTIPRNTLHKRTTKDSVTLILISTSGRV